MNTYLVGLPGVGKSTIGRLLAEKLNQTFIDLDLDIEKSTGLTIPEIFEYRGEEYFREVEKLALERTFEYSQTIVATGGGTPCFFDNMEQMKEHGKVIYLQSTLEQILNNLKKEEGESRPLLAKNLSEQKIKNLLSEREKQYLQSHEIIKVSIDLEDTLKDILHKTA